ncbi:MAG: phosphate acyltransferase [Gemmatimonadota bacterium]
MPTDPPSNPGGFIGQLRKRAAARPARIGFPESDEPRTSEAIERLRREGLVIPIPLGGSDSAGSGAHAALESALRLLADADVDGVVAGAATATSDVIRAGLRTLGVAPGFATVSSVFYMVLGDGGEEKVLSFTDAGVVPRPTAEQLAESADAAATGRTTVVGDEPRVAFLSYSTHGSAEGPDVERVREGLSLFRVRRPDVAADGELQADAAVVPDVGRSKAPGSSVAGSANVLVFPDLASGNIGYKLVERLVGARALGPILQGLSAPLNDLSRGASVADIVDVACITAIMSQRGGEG